MPWLGGFSQSMLPLEEFARIDVMPFMSEATPPVLTTVPASLENPGPCMRRDGVGTGRRTGMVISPDGRTALVAWRTREGTSVDEWRALRQKRCVRPMA